MTQSTTVFGVSKSTLAGVLTGLIGTFSSILGFQVPMALLNPQQTHVWLWLTTGANLLVIILKVWLGVVTNDAPVPTPPPTDALGKPVPPEPKP